MDLFGQKVATKEKKESFFPVMTKPNHDSKDIEPKYTGEHMTGTSIMAVAYDGGVVIGADSRTSTGQYVSNRVTDKLDKVSDYIYCARSGSASDTQAISDIVEYYLDLHSLEVGGPPTVQTAAALFQEVVYNNKDRLLAGIIVAGWDKNDGGSVYTVSLGGATVKQGFAIGGSGSTYIFGYCDSHYKPKMTKAECQDFVKKGLSHAIARDGYSGGVIRLATIDKDGCQKIMIPGDKLAFMGPLYG